MRTNNLFDKISIILLVFMLVLGVNSTLSANQKKVDKAPEEKKLPQQRTLLIQKKML